MKHLSKKTKIPNNSKKTNHTQQQIPSYYIRYIIVPSIILVSVLTAKLIIKTYTYPMVLGTSTYMLADSQTPVKYKNETSTATVSGNISNVMKDEIKKANAANALRNVVTVDCIGPDKKHFQVSYQECRDLNESWNNPNFSFTPLSNQQAKYVETPNLLDQTNVSSVSAHKFIIRKANTETNTKESVSFSSESGKLMLATNSGKMLIQIEPDQAINMLLQKNVLTTIETNSTDLKDASPSGLLTQTVAKSVILSVVNNQPVFIINGLSKKKILGLIPIQFAKTVYVSTDTGQVIKTNQTSLTKLLESISF